MKKDLKSFLKENKFLVGLPVNINFPRKSGGNVKVKAKKFTEVMKYSDVKTALRLKREEIINKIKTWDDYTMGNILDEDLKQL